jgi:hypothetical protein
MAVTTHKKMTKDQELYSSVDGIFDAMVAGSSKAKTMLGTDQDFRLAMKGLLTDACYTSSSKTFIVPPVGIESLELQQQLGISVLPSRTETLKATLTEILEASKQTKGIVKVGMPIIQNNHWVYLRFQLSNGELFKAELIDSLGAVHPEREALIESAVKSVAPHAVFKATARGVQKDDGYTCMDWVVQQSMKDLGIKNDVTCAANGKDLRAKNIAAIQRNALSPLVDYDEFYQLLIVRDEQGNLVHSDLKEMIDSTLARAYQDAPDNLSEKAEQALFKKIRDKVTQDTLVNLHNAVTHSVKSKRIDENVKNSISVLQKFGVFAKAQAPRKSKADCTKAQPYTDNLEIAWVKL